MTKSQQAWELATRRQRKGKDKPTIGIKHGLVEKGVKAEPEKKVTAQKPYKLMSLSEYCVKRAAAGKVKPGRSAFVMMRV